MREEFNAETQKSEDAEAVGWTGAVSADALPEGGAAHRARGTFHRQV